MCIFNIFYSVDCFSCYYLLVVWRTKKLSKEKKRKEKKKRRTVKTINKLGYIILSILVCITIAPNPSYRLPLFSLEIPALQ